MRLVARALWLGVGDGVRFAEHNYNTARGESVRMLRRLTRGSVRLALWQLANRGGGSSRRRMVATNARPFSEELKRVPCACRGAAPALDAKVSVARALVANTRAGERAWAGEVARG